MTSIEYRHELYYGGRWMPAAGGDLTVVNPATEALLAAVPGAAPVDVAAAVAAARRAFDTGGWPRLTPAERANWLTALAGRYATYADPLVRLIVDEVGSPITWATAKQVPDPLAILRYYAQAASWYSFAEYRCDQTGHALLTREPAGVVAAIVPWNMPQKTIMMKLAPALLAGCTIIVKPAPQSPLDGLALAAIVHEVGFPPGVVNILPADTYTGEALVRHPGVDKVAFTGSTAAGRRIASLCGADIRRVSLELGGKSPTLVFPDADLDRFTGGVLGDCLANSGQICSNHTRILVHRSVHDEVVDRLCTLATSLTVGDPLDPDTQIGPLVTAAQRDRVASYICHGIQQGGKIRVGGERPKTPRTGWYLEATVFTDITPDNVLFQDEVFGPVLTVTPFDDPDDAVRLANDSRYGLDAGVWTGDEQLALDVAQRLRAGNVRINGYPIGDHTPLGGFKQSGIGRELGPEGLAGYLETKALSLHPNHTCPTR